ncbi:hypothetical protein SeMB42_g03169 [Synchytrium endobioticum]|uniref:Uncharacterized protein n=1 Tax=Synchytrium endobioticum TaxID=286115 RepID=A0A507D0T9_9FUNG|nr:hypothetical protein SeLEV6574_g04108 [Synchytrium endobioticum]TPX47850.1 hypothetical protein SeMB42_g03169 [Synchytrium endobioticum]
MPAPRAPFVVKHVDDDILARPHPALAGIHASVSPSGSAQTHALSPSQAKRVVSIESKLNQAARLLRQTRSQFGVDVFAAQSRPRPSSLAPSSSPPRRSVSRCPSVPWLIGRPASPIRGPVPYSPRPGKQKAGSACPVRDPCQGMRQGDAFVPSLLVNLVQRPHGNPFDNPRRIRLEDKREAAITAVARSYLD